MAGADDAKKIGRSLEAAVRSFPKAPPTANRRRQIVQDLLAANAAEVDGLSARRAAAVLPPLRQARAELQADLASWLRTVGGSERWTAQHLRNALARVRRAVNRLEGFKDVREAMERQLVEGSREAAMLSVAHVERELAVFSQVFEGSLDAPVNFHLVADLAVTDGQRIRQYRNSAARYTESMRKDIGHQLAVGVAKRETFDQMTRRLQRHGGPRGLVALRGRLGQPGAFVELIPEGLFRRYRYWAERVVRTEMITAYNVQHRASIEDVAADDPEFQLRWDASLDRRVCRICRGLDGIVINVGETFPGGFRHPTAHPNCRCCVVPWKASWPEYLGMEDYDRQPAILA